MNYQKKYQKCKVPSGSSKFSQNFWPLLDWKIFSHVSLDSDILHEMILSNEISNFNFPKNFQRLALLLCQKMTSVVTHSHKYEQCTGWPKSKFEISFGYNSETMHFWLYVSKAKMGLRAVQLFCRLWRNSRKSKWMYSSLKTCFSFTKKWSEMHSFRVIAKRNVKFWFGSPCTTCSRTTFFSTLHIWRNYFAKTWHFSSW